MPETREKLKLLIYEKYSSVNLLLESTFAFQKIKIKKTIGISDNMRKYLLAISEKVLNRFR